MGEGGAIHVETGSRNGWASLSVTDNGCGMSPEFLARSLFRPFQTTKKKGIGIGMFLSRMIVDAHKGKIEVASRLGKGTTFRILLPLQGDVTMRSELLIVDDDEGIRSQMKWALSQDYDVFLAEDRPGGLGGV